MSLKSILVGFTYVSNVYGTLLMILEKELGSANRRLRTTELKGKKMRKVFRRRQKCVPNSFRYRHRKKSRKGKQNLSKHIDYLRQCFSTFF
jgi:hypothetical protein